MRTLRDLACAAVMPIVLAGIAWTGPALADVGDTSDALPGLVRVPVPTTPDRTGVAFAATAGYGYTESVLGAGDAHQRALGAVAASFQPARFFAFGLRLDGHYDKSSANPSSSTTAESASGGVGTSRLEARVGTSLGGALRIGGQVGLWFPGGSAPSFVPAAITPDASLLASISPAGSAITVASRVGFRLDNSAKAITNADQLSPVGRLSLGYNQADAVLLGLGSAIRLSSRVELLVDATWDLLVGSGAPAALQGPIVVDVGVRYWLDRAGAWQIALGGDVSPSQRPPIGVGSPLVDVEPLVGAYLGITVRPFSHPEQEAPPLPPAAMPELPPPPAPIVRARLVGHVVAANGQQPIARAHVTLRKKAQNAEQAGEARSATTDEQGQFVFDDLDPADVSVEVVAEGFVPMTRTVVVSDSPAPLQIPLVKALPSGQVRGLIRNFAGKPIAATIRIEPVGVEVHVDPDGRFQANVAPGTYQLVIHAAGYVDQRRRVVVEKDGVTMLNAELRTAR